MTGLCDETLKMLHVPERAAERPPPMAFSRRQGHRAAVRPRGEVWQPRRADLADAECRSRARAPVPEGRRAPAADPRSEDPATERRRGRGARGLSRSCRISSESPHCERQSLRESVGHEKATKRQEGSASEAGRPPPCEGQRDRRGAAQLRPGLLAGHAPALRPLGGREEVSCRRESSGRTSSDHVVRRFWREPFRLAAWMQRKLGCPPTPPAPRPPSGIEFQVRAASVISSRWSSESDLDVRK